ncbi:MAG: hypothetical protein O7G85_07160 [Planctomycetota bacterium]|nr:hypothetical protein [Planctomycetota bacterium]
MNKKNSFQFLVGFSLLAAAIVSVSVYAGSRENTAPVSVTGDRVELTQEVSRTKAPSDLYFIPVYDQYCNPYLINEDDWIDFMARTDFVEAICMGSKVLYWRMYDFYDTGSSCDTSYLWVRLGCADGQECYGVEDFPNQAAFDTAVAANPCVFLKTPTYLQDKLAKCWTSCN